MANDTTPRETKKKTSNGQSKALNAKTKKGLWARYTDRLKNTHCTLTPPECR
jgi:hypothetical protein